MLTIIPDDRRCTRRWCLGCFLCVVDVGSPAPSRHCPGFCLRSFFLIPPLTRPSMESSPWGDDDHSGPAVEWTRMSNEFTNVSHWILSLSANARFINTTQAGYREGITAGKESSVQRGFNDGYAIGAALGRRSGIARGSLIAMLSFLTSARSLSLPDDVRDSRSRDAREILALLSDLHVKGITGHHHQTDNDHSDHETVEERQEKCLASVTVRVHELARLIGVPDHVIDTLISKT